MAIIFKKQQRIVRSGLKYHDFGCGVSILGIQIGITLPKDDQVESVVYKVSYYRTSTTERIFLYGGMQTGWLRGHLYIT